MGPPTFFFVSCYLICQVQIVGYLKEIAGDLTKFWFIPINCMIKVFLYIKLLKSLILI